MNLTIYSNGIIQQLERENRRGSAKAYRTALRKAVQFGGDKLTLDIALTREWLARYQDWLRKKNCLQNTISSYMRVLKRCHSQAVDEGLIEDTPRLFSHVFTGYDSTPKRALTLKVINKIYQADLSHNKKLEFCRDIFMLSFILYGMPFVDLAHLRKCDVHNGCITYQRKKSGSPVTVPIHPEAQKIIDKYAHLTQDIPYLLPIITDSNKDERKQYEAALHKQNRHLKLVALEVGVKENLTTYVARHSWATAAHHEKVSTSVISQAMGHQTEEVTVRYLSEFDYKELKKANRVVMKALEKIAEQEEKKDVRHYTSTGHP